MEYIEKTLTTLNDNEISVLADKRLKEITTLVYQVSYIKGDKVTAINVGITDQENGIKRPLQHVNSIQDKSAKWLANNENEVDYVKIDILASIERKESKQLTRIALEELEGKLSLEKIKQGFKVLNKFKYNGIECTPDILQLLAI